MAWDAGTILGSRTIGPKTTAGTLAAKFNALVGGSGVANWSFVENIPAGTGTGQTGSASTSCDVFKCSGSSTNANDAGVDWYLGITSTQADPGSWSSTIVAEDYSPIASVSNKGMFRKQCPVAGNTAPDAVNFTFNETYQTVNALSKHNFSPTTSVTTGFSYWIKLTNNFVIFTIRVGVTTSSIYCGLFDSVITSHTDTMPLLTATGGSGTFSRLPGVTGAAGGANQWGVTLFPWTQPGLYTISSATTGSDFWGTSGGATRVPVTRIGVSHATTAYNTYGSLRGVLKSDVLYYAYNSTATVAPGDTVDVGGTTYTVISPAVGIAGYTTGAFSGPSGYAGAVITRAN